MPRRRDARSLLAALICVSALPVAAWGQAVDCPMERAVYTIPGHDGHEFGFPLADHPALQTALAPTLRSHESGNTYRFDYSASMGYSLQYLVPVAQPPLIDDAAAGSSLGLFFFDEALNSVSLAPEGEQAPAYLFVPELGRFLWYDVALPEGREALPTEIWHLSDCRPATAPDAGKQLR